MSLPSHTFAVTGSTGVLGRLVAEGLSREGRASRLLVRDASRAPALPGTEIHECTYSDADAARIALTGVDTLFMVSAAESVDRVDQHCTFIDAARDAGVGHIVYTSFFGASPTCTFTLGRDHAATEQHLRDSGPGFTFLRDNLYLDFMGALAGKDGIIRGPAGDGRVSAVSRRDIARAALAVLAAPSEHDSKTYDLTGPESLTFSEIAAILTSSLGKPFGFVNETFEEAYASRAQYGAPDWQVDAWVSTYIAIASGEMAGVSPDLENLTGTPPLGLADWLSLPS